MGTTAWVEVTSDDFEIDNSGIRGDSFFIKIGESHLQAYMWGVDCPDTGYLELRDFRKQLDSIKSTDVNWWYGYGYDSDDIEHIDLSDMRVSPTYDAKVEFTLNGGWTGPLSLDSGEVDISDRKYGNDTYIDVELDIKFRGDEKLRGGYVTLYCEEVIFHPSKTFTQIYNYCWDSWDADDFYADDVKYLFPSMNARPKSKGRSILKRKLGQKPRCRRCGSKLKPSPVEGYTWYCPDCDEDFYSFEVE